MHPYSETMNHPRRIRKKRDEMKINIEDLPDSGSLFGRVGLRAQCMNPYCRKPFVLLVRLQYKMMAKAIMAAIMNGDIDTFCQDCVMDMVKRTGGEILPVDAKTGEIAKSLHDD
jgi:hypothetical protein